LYEAKRSGRDRIVARPDVSTEGFGPEPELAR
jgi:hypothetical protein